MATRRRFVSAACGAALLPELVSLGCGRPAVTDLGNDDDDDGISPVPTVTPDGNLVTLAVADYPQLANVEGVAFAYVASLLLYVIVVRTGDTTFIALDAKCTHRNCLVGYQTPSDDFYCNCHGARFALTGAVTAGPATTPLRVFPATFDGAIVTVDVSAAAA